MLKICVTLFSAAATAYAFFLLRDLQVQRVQRVGGKSQYLVHYQGWHKRFDEWLPEERVLEATEANLAHARAVNARVDEELAAAKQSKRDRERAAAAAERAEAAAPALAPATLSGGKRKANPARETEEDVAPAALTFGGPPAPSVKFSMLPALKKQLVDDWDRITQKKLLVRLPRPAGLHTASSALDAYIVHLHATAAAEGGTGSGSASAASAASEAAQYATPETVAAALHSCSSVTMPFGFKAARDAIEGLRLYFDRALPLYLLYRFERLQLDAWLKHVQGGGGGGVSSARAGSNSAAAAASFAASAVYGPEHLLRLFIKLPDLLAHISLSDEETKVLQITVNDLLKCVRARFCVCVCGGGDTAYTAGCGQAHARAPPRQLLTASPLSQRLL